MAKGLGTGLGHLAAYQHYLEHSFDLGWVGVSGHLFPPFEMSIIED